jgi:hypothetical protein
MTMSATWYEVWADEGHDVPYVLLLRPARAEFEIRDPAEKNRIVFESPRYDDAKMWLLEDEFVLGRAKGNGRLTLLTPYIPVS